MNVIPVNTQLLRAYPIILDMLRTRGYLADSYPVITQKDLQDITQLEPIIVRGKNRAFAADSLESNVLSGVTKSGGDVDPTFAQRYPALCKVLIGSDVANLTDLYADVCIPIAEVHFHQCFTNANQWMPNARDGGNRFMTDMDQILANLDETANLKIAAYWTNHNLEYGAENENLKAELVTLFKQHRTVVFMYRTTRNKASATLDQKYEKYCDRIMATHKMMVQLFNLRHLMFNITQHEKVPRHELLDVWHDRSEVDEMCKKYNVKRLTELPFIAQNDPVAKFIGLRRGNIAKITRINRGSGTFVVYRLCK